MVGGAGYIGSHMVEMLYEAGYKPIVLDNLSTGYSDVVLHAEFVEGDIADRALLDQLFSDYEFKAVFHFASYIQVGESVLNPQKYYQNNLVNTLTLLDAMIAHHVNHFIFSSTAAVYGEPQYMPLDVDHPKSPVNPYGKSKWMVEQILEDYDRAYGLRYVALRYFNAAGADPHGRLGERHEPETHLIPLILQVASGRRSSIELFGDDYETPDGTCIRDYVHVNDLCQAHLLALDFLTKKNRSAAYNLGNGQGFSVKEVLSAIEKVTQKKIAHRISPRRAGDPARLIADATLAKTELGWQPQFEKLETIIQHAWEWESKQS